MSFSESIVCSFAREELEEKEERRRRGKKARRETIGRRPSISVGHRLPYFLVVDALLEATSYLSSRARACAKRQEAHA